jgi:ATP-binding cassette, subfamily F, member 3
MIRLRLDKVTFSYPSKPVLNQISCEIQDRCYGVIGPNGSGKSTLLKLMRGQLTPDKGFIARDKKLVIAHMSQDMDLPPDAIAYEVVIQGADRVRALEKELKALDKKFADPHYYNHEGRLAGLIGRQEKCLEAYHQLGGPGLDGRVKALLTAIGFKEHEMELQVRHLSGGQKKLLGLAKIIIARPDVLLLDEPDNHLDLDGKAMLEKLIKDFQGSVVIVSHDRYFLDMVVDEILDVEYGSITQFKGNYSEYMFDKRVRQENLLQQYQLQQKEITRLEQAANRLLMWGSVHDVPKLIKRGKSILKRIERIEVIEKPQINPDKIDINIRGWRGSQKVLEIKDLQKSFPKPNGSGRAQVLQGIDLLLRYGDRVGVIGPNGVGKSLLIRMILSQVKPDAGDITIGPSIKPAYYAQEFETLNPDERLLDTIRKIGPFSESRGVAFMKKFLFAYEQRNTLVGKLSGGERSRLQIAKITLSGANFLLLDEPTNHLDIPSCEVLEDALLDFDGTILAVSHDRYFLDRIANRIIELHSDRIESFMGNYSDYERDRSSRGKS